MNHDGNLRLRSDPGIIYTICRSTGCPYCTRLATRDRVTRNRIRIVCTDVIARSGCKRTNGVDTNRDVDVARPFRRRIGTASHHTNRKGDRNEDARVAGRQVARVIKVVGVDGRLGIIIALPKLVRIVALAAFEFKFRNRFGADAPCLSGRQI